MPETVKTINLSTGYLTKKGPAVITSGINASLHSGELTCLLGPNGAGKSTLLKTLSAFLPPIGGEITIEGRSISKYQDSELARTLGVVLTERLSLANMSTEGLIGLGRSPYTGFFGNLNDNDRRIVDEAMSLVRIENLKGRMVQTLSDGERQKVLIAKALAQETPIIFLDEPTAFLDYPSKVEIMQLLLRLSRLKDKTIFLSTHDMDLALQTADTVWLIDKPHGVTVGTPEDLALSGDLERYFIREGILFDMESGIFRIDNKTTSTIQLIGKGRRAAMARKALLRIGIATTESCGPAITVKVTETGFSISENKGDYSDEMKTITSLIEILRSINRSR